MTTGATVRHPTSKRTQRTKHTLKIKARAMAQDLRAHTASRGSEHPPQAAHNFNSSSREVQCLWHLWTCAGTCGLGGEHIHTHMHACTHIHTHTQNKSKSLWKHSRLHTRLPPRLIWMNDFRVSLTIWFISSLHSSQSRLCYIPLFGQILIM